MKWINLNPLIISKWFAFFPQLLFHCPSVFTFPILNMERGNTFCYIQQQRSANTPGCYCRVVFFSYLMQLFSNYRRKTTWHYAHLHTSLGIYCYHYSGMILKPTKCTYFALKKPQKTFAGLTEWEQSARQELPCLPKIPVPIMSVHTQPHWSIKNYLKRICPDTQTWIEYPGITLNMYYKFLGTWTPLTV